LHHKTLPALTHAEIPLYRIKAAEYCRSNGAILHRRAISAIDGKQMTTLVAIITLLEARPRCVNRISTLRGQRRTSLIFLSWQARSHPARPAMADECPHAFALAVSFYEGRGLDDFPFTESHALKHSCHECEFGKSAIKSKM
jgi:hypothetical protein